MSTKFNPSYIGTRKDILKVLTHLENRPMLVLDVGCATGEAGKCIRKQFGAVVHGVELDRDMANAAQANIDRVFAGSAEEFLKREDRDEQYDLILLADVLEHTIDPWNLLKLFGRRLNKDGVIVLSLPNIRHWTTIFELAVRGNWPHRERGIHDKTHLRFFTLRTIRDLVNGSGMTILKIRRNLRIREGFGKINRVSGITNVPGIRAFFTFQYILVCKPKDELT